MASNEKTLAHGSLRALHLALTAAAFPLAMAYVGDIHYRHGSSSELVQVLAVMLGGGTLSLGLVIGDQLAYPHTLLASLAFTGPMVANAATSGGALDGAYSLAYAALGSQALALAYAIITRWTATDDWFARVYLVLMVLANVFCLYWFRGPFVARFASPATLATAVDGLPFALQVACGGWTLSRRLFGTWSPGRWLYPSIVAANLSMIAGWITYGFSQS